MFFAWLSTIIILPFTVIAIIPALLLWVSGYGYDAPSFFASVTGWLLLGIGFTLAAWAMGLFHSIGKGTAAPWNPPKNLVIWGPYRHVRNPMIISVLTVLAAETILLGSWVVAAWGVAFFALNQFYYFPRVEEPKLLERFGKEYAEYKEQVNRWIPRLMGIPKSKGE